jgi:hypothetical protein
MVAPDAYDPAATSGPTSPAGYKAALAAKLGISADDITVTPVQNADGTWKIEVRGGVRVRVRVRVLGLKLTRTPNPSANP